MKKIAFCTALGFIVLFTGSLFAREPLTFEERVKAQEAIERVYYNHRIWPKENPQPKPPFEQMVTKEQIEAKVTDYLKKSTALDQFWQRPIEGKQLQAEMDRMAKGTKDPVTLNELFKALNDDPYLIAECLARPVLADRLVRNWYANDERFHKETREKAEKTKASLTKENFCESTEGQYSEVIYRLQVNNETPEEFLEPARNEIKLSQEEFGRIYAETPEEWKISDIQETNEAFIIKRTILKNEVEIEIESLSWQKKNADEWLKETGVQAVLPESDRASESAYLPPMAEADCEDIWLPSRFAVPQGRSGHTAVWTGTEMIIWGGSASNYVVNTGGRYNPSTDLWVPTSTGSNCPAARKGHIAIWTGSEMIIWGGVNDSNYCSYVGGKYNPLNDTWTLTSSGTFCPTGRVGLSAIWTGTEMIIWGGNDASGCCPPNYLNTGGKYNPSTDTWMPTSTGENCPSARTGHTAIWTETEMIVWGGNIYTASFNTGGRYNPISDNWIATSIGVNCPSIRSGHTAVWTGTAMIIWGGNSNIGGKYDPSSDTWQSTSIGTYCPSARTGHNAVWTGTDMIIWGGGSNTGGIYNPSDDTWTLTSTGTNCPSARGGTTAVWTETEMIVWGGEGDLNTGGRYNPSTDLWVPVAFAGESPSRVLEGSSVVWTGSEMIAWGGTYLSGGTHYNLNTGVRYSPSTDNMEATSIGTNVPVGREWHAAVWTGTEMIIWGGYWYNGSSQYEKTGGRYNPISDSWLPTSTTTNCPTQRYGHTSVWTGTEMIIWGGILGSTRRNDGGRYNPNSDSWIATSTGTNCPTARWRHTSIWTGTDMIIWGGDSSVSPYVLNTGGIYNPISNFWTSTSTGANVPAARSNHTAIWTNSEMVIWGGGGVDIYFNSGGKYNPSTNTWSTTLTDSNCPVKRINHSAIWSGSEMIVWGGYYVENLTGYYLNSGGRYIPSTNTWTPTASGTYLPSERASHLAIWTGNKMIVYGGSSTWCYGGIYQPGTPPQGIPNCSPQDINSCTKDVLVTWPTNPTNWNDSGGTYSRQYRLYRDGSPISSGGCSGYLAYETTACTDTTTTANADHTYAVEYFNSCGAASKSETTSIVDQAMTTPTIAGPSPACESASLSTQTYSSYQWYKDGSPISGATSKNYSTISGGSYTVSVTDSNGCAATSSPFIVNSIPVPIISGASGGCSSVALSTGTYATYQWKKNGISIPGAISRTYSATESGNYTVTVTSAASCTGTSAAKTVTVSSTPTPSITGQNANICPDGFVSLIATSGFTSYQWYKDGETINGATLQNYEMYETGNYAVLVIDAVGCEGFSADHYVTISFCSNAEVSGSSAVFPLRIEENTGSTTGFYIYFQKVGGASGYNIYEGDIVSPWDAIYHHDNKTGSVCGATVFDLGTGEMRAEITPSEGNHYYLVSAYGSGSEGPSGFNSANVEIDPSQSTCTP